MMDNIGSNYITIRVLLGSCLSEINTHISLYELKLILKYFRLIIVRNNQKIVVANQIDINNSYFWNKILYEHMMSSSYFNKMYVGKFNNSHKFKL